VLLGGAWAGLRHRRKRLEQRQASEITGAPVTTPETEQERSFFQQLQHYLSLQRRLQIVLFLQWLLFWALVFVWVIAIAYSLNLFPQTQHIARRVIFVPIAILLTWFLAGLINRSTDFFIDRFIQNRRQDQVLSKINLQRITTVANVLKGLKRALIYIVGILILLQWLNLVSGSILVLGAVTALAFSFAAQSLVKDLVNGFLILLEDQFRIGDNVKIGTVSGMVEDINLRITQIRSDEGELITLPNSLITQVQNRSRLWARADVSIEVAYGTDVDRALSIVRSTIEQMASDPAWQAIILVSPEMLGVEQISHAGIVIRLWIRTLPLKQWETARELRRRLKIAFDAYHVQIGIPQQIWLENGSENLQN
jgi:small conductance mechanosensitive channel